MNPADPNSPNGECPREIAPDPARGARFLAAACGRGLASPRAAIALLGALGALGVGATVRPDLAAHFGKNWFASGLAALSVNLACIAWGWRTPRPPAWDPAGPEPAPSGYRVAEFASPGSAALPSSAEGLRKFVSTLSGPGDLKRMRSSVGSATLGIELGRLSSLAHRGSVAALAVAAAGAAASLWTGFQARVIVAEGARADHAEPVRGTMPVHWKPYVRGTRAFPGLVALGFEIESLSPHRLRIHYDGREGGRNGIEDVLLAPGRAARQGGLTFRLLGEGPASARDADLTVVEGASGEGVNAKARRFPKAPRGAAIDLEAYRFEVLEIQPESELNGAAAHLEYEEAGKAPERFWVFKEFPDYDFVHRKASRAHFRLHEVTQRKSLEVRVGRDPGAPVAWAALALAAILAGISRAWPHRRWWLGAVEGGRMRLVGWGAAPEDFATRFQEANDRIQRKLSRGEGKRGRS